MATITARNNLREVPKKPGRPAVESFDSGYEHSPDHWIAVKNMVEEADEEPATPAWLYAMGVKA